MEPKNWVTRLVYFISDGLTSFCKGKTGSRPKFSTGQLVVLELKIGCSSTELPKETQGLHVQSMDNMTILALLNCQFYWQNSSECLACLSNMGTTTIVDSWQNLFCKFQHQVVKSIQSINDKLQFLVGGFNPFWKILVKLDHLPR